MSGLLLLPFGMSGLHSGEGRFQEMHSEATSGLLVNVRGLGRKAYYCTGWFLLCVLTLRYLAAERYGNWVTISTSHKQESLHNYRGDDSVLRSHRNRRTQIWNGLTKLNSRVNGFGKAASEISGL